MIQGYAVLRRLFLIQWLFCSMTYLVCDATLAFCSLQKYLIRAVRAIFSIPYSSQSPDIGQNSDGGISEFRISGQSLIKINCHNSWTSDDIDIKLGLVTKLDKRKKKCQKIWRWRHVEKLWRRYHFSNLRPIWNNLEAGFRTHSL